jgi:acyl-coenzyme A synthetase/AMP-(fatty) acid ligase
MMEDSEAVLVVADRGNISLARDLAGDSSRVIEFESIDNAIPDDDPRLDLSPQALAFISYTSGSTGQPKGVVQSHRDLVHDTMQYTNAYHLCKYDRLSLLSSGTSNAVKITFYAIRSVSLTIFSTWAVIRSRPQESRLA